VSETEPSIIQLQAEAQEAARFSYSPYSRFRVGAALLGASGRIYRGTNVENRSLGVTNCAERTAFFTALTSGEKEFVAIAVFSPDSDVPLSPCGACRQVISEFVSPEFPIYFSGKDGKFIRAEMRDMFPFDTLHDLANR